MARPAVVRSVVRNHLVLAYTFAVDGGHENARRMVASLWFLNAENHYLLPRDLNTEARRLLSELYAQSLIANRVPEWFDRSVYGARLNRVGQIYGIDFWSEYRSIDATWTQRSLRTRSTGSGTGCASIIRSPSRTPC